MSARNVSFNEMIQFITDEKLSRVLKICRDFQRLGLEEKTAVALALACLAPKCELPPAVALTEKDFENKGPTQKKNSPKEKRQKKRTQSTLNMM